jgi:hypothetical protein
MCVFKSSHHHPHGRLTFCFLFAGRRCLCQWWLSDHLFVHDQWEHSKRGAHSCSKSPIAPMGRSLTCPNRLSSFNWDRSLVLPGICMCHPHLQTSHRPHGRLTFDCCLQGGGVLVGGGTVTFSSCTISGNQASYVRGLTLKSSHRPDGKIADVLALILACTTATDASVN